MRSVTTEYKEAMVQRTNFTARANIKFQSGTTITINAERFTVQNNGFTDSAGASAFPLGEAICRTVQLELMNADDYFTDYDFFGAEITLFLDFPGFPAEPLTIGKYTVLTPATYGETVIVSAADDMWRADKPYETDLTYTASSPTLDQVFVEACTKCGIPYRASYDFPNKNLVVPAASSDYTFREVFGFIAMIAGGNARISYDGYMEILTYKFIGETVQPDHVLNMWKSLTTDTSNVTITGVQTEIEAEDEESDSQTVLVGSSGYVLSLDNPFFGGQEQSVLTLISNVICNNPFRVFDGEYIAYPIAEFMDTVQIVDRKGNTYNSIVTDIDFTFGSYTTLSCSAESAIQTNGTFSSPVKETIIQAKKLVVQERTQREAAVQQLADALANVGGLYRTDVYSTVDSSVLVAYLLHNKPTAEESTAVIRITADAIGFSTNGGQTYPYGVQINGTILASMLYAIGVNADWVRTGKITTEDGTSYIDLDNGTFSLAGGLIRFDGTSLTIGALVDLQEQIDDTISAVEAQRGFISIIPTEPSITLGKDGSPNNLKVSDSGITINGEGGSQMTLTESRLNTKEAKIGNLILGDFYWTNDADGNLFLKWGGI